MRKSHLAFLLILAVGSATGLWFGARSSPVEGPARVVPVPVGASAAARRDVPVYLLGLGNVQAYNSVTVRAQIDGQITEVAFKEGQDVNVGDVLVKIDRRSYQATLDQAVAKRAQDQAQLDNARRDLKRYNELIQSNSIARQQFDTTQAQVEQLQAAVKGDDASIEYAQVNLGYATIRSPIKGRVGIRKIDGGNVVHVNDPNGIVTITETRPISVLFTLPEDALQDIVKAMAAGPLPVAALSRDGKQQFDVGELTLIDNAVDQTTGTIQLKATLPNAAGLLWPGQFVTTRLHLSTRRGVLTVPFSAIQNGPEGSFAFIIKSDSAVEIRKLKLGLVNDETAVVEAGLEEGDLVVTSGQYRLQPGSKVHVEGSPPATPVVASRRDD
ncbi:efflux RND transporter periplasmic adaptor subunit [Methylocapsa polymorpha]|uniref:Efflux RND transporter periplasmic adaptor subunit n=1 Tax=Methylocapsa polymorpha TaxID=3080828 RepID=A0ABZ0HVD6_9HYPH|nr:efflux RND transporter periplasmic adaptor subunit [Methylocapsa sp. RX1]